MVEKRPGEPGPALALQTDGVNFEGAWGNPDVIDITAGALPIISFDG